MRLSSILKPFGKPSREYSQRRHSPVHLNLEGKDRDLVGLGSYWVNALSDCNGCHSAGPATEYIVPTGNPYFLSPPFSGKQQINPATYLGGGRDFGVHPKNETGN